MKLYYSDVLAPRKACAVAGYLRSPVEYVYLDLARGEHKTPEYLSLNPNGKVPTLVDGERSLWEADAIMCELARRAGSDLWPSDAERQIEILRWLSWDKQHFGHYGAKLFFECIVKPRFVNEEPDAPAVERHVRHFRQYAAILDSHLGDRAWLVGERPSVADFALAVALPYVDRLHVSLGDLPAVQRWHERLNQFDAWRNPFPHCGPEATT